MKSGFYFDIDTQLHTQERGDNKKNRTSHEGTSRIWILRKQNVHTWDREK